MAENGFTLQVDEEFYRILGPDGEEGDMVPYGSVAVLKIEDAIYYAFIEDADSDEAEVMRTDAVTPMTTEYEDVTFPATVIAAQRALDAALDGAGGGPQIVEAGEAAEGEEEET